MATAANLIFRSSRGDEGTLGARSAVVRESEAGTANLYALRPLPNEGLYFYVKSFDNTRVVRQADPHAGRTAWKALGGACVAASLLVALLLPGAYRLMAGYQIDRLKERRAQSQKELRSLEFEEARLLRMDRMQELADRNFAPPKRDQVQFLESKDSVARLREARQ